MINTPWHSAQNQAHTELQHSREYSKQWCSFFGVLQVAPLVLACQVESWSDQEQGRIADTFDLSLPKWPLLEYHLFHELRYDDAVCVYREMGMYCIWLLNHFIHCCNS